MSDNQYVFEIIRDVGYLIQQIEDNETLWLNVKNDGNGFYTARSSSGMPCGASETSRAIEEAYKVSRSCPDERDKKIDGLQKVIQMCFDDACKPSGKISKKTALELMKYADTKA
jgi:hypothetical protein